MAVKTNLNNPSGGKGTGRSHRAIIKDIEDNFLEIAGTIATNKADLPVSVKAYGAIGDGVATDTTAINEATAAALAQKKGLVRFPGGTYKFTYTQPPLGVTWLFEGPETNSNILGTTDFHLANQMMFGYLQPDHTTFSRSLYHIKGIAKGAGLNGASRGDFALRVTFEKENWTKTTCGDGEIDGISVYVRQGAKPDTHLGDCAGLTMNVGGMKDTGFICCEESVASSFVPVTFAIGHQIGHQTCVINDLAGDYYGEVYYINSGQAVAGIRFNGQTAARFNLLLQSVIQGSTYFTLSDLGDIKYFVPGINNDIHLEGSTGDIVVSDNAKQELFKVAQSGVVSASKIFSKGTTLNVASAGTTQSGATLLTTNNAVITNTPLNGGVKMPAIAGAEFLILNRGTNPINVYPFLGGQVDALGVDLPTTIAIGANVRIFCASPTQYYTI